MPRQVPENSNDQTPEEIDVRNAIITIMEGTSGHTGKKFFQLLVKKLAVVLNTTGAWVTEYLEEEGRLRAFAFWFNGKWVDHYEYSIKGTPCEQVVRNACRIHLPENVIELYPDDPDLKQFNAVSYLGEPLLDSSGRVIGHLAILDTKTMPQNPVHLAIFRIFSARAAAELTRLKAEDEVKEREERLTRLIDSAMDGIVEVDENLTITQLNPAATKLLGYSTQKISGKKLTDYIIEDDRARLRILAKRLLSYPEGKKYLWVPGGLTLFTSDGERLMAEATLSLSELHGEIHYTLIFRSIKDRMEAEEIINKLTFETEYLKEEVRNLQNFGEITGSSQPLLRVLKDVKQVAATDTTVLITGETGTGKELVARAVHAESKRSGKPLIKVNCAAIPSELIESEFFGHEKGAFTGATSKREGRFKLADGGTIFLDEIGELPLQLQSKLLRVLQEGEFEPVGSSKTVKVNVRVLAATNRNLKHEVEEGKFREDLYYRLNVFPINVPPLREREDDLLELAESFVSRYAKAMGKDIKPLTENNKLRLKSYNWPGNVRELQNVIERAVITSVDRTLNLDSSLPEIGNNKSSKAVTDNEYSKQRIRTIGEMQELERKNILMALNKCKWKISGKEGAADLLGMPPTTLSSRIKALNIKKTD